MVYVYMDHVCTGRYRTCVSVTFVDLQDIVRLLFGKDVKDVDVDMVVKKRNEFMADRGKKVFLLL